MRQTFFLPWLMEKAGVKEKQQRFDLKHVHFHFEKKKKREKRTGFYPICAVVAALVFKRPPQ